MTETTGPDEDPMSRLWREDQDEFYRLLNIASAIKAGIKIPRDKALNLARKSALRNQELLRRLAAATKGEK